MKNQLLSISFSFLIFPINNSENPAAVADKHFANTNFTSTIIGNATADLIYSDMNLAQAGLSEKAFEYAYKGYLSLKKSGKLEKDDKLTICDFSQSSGKKRLYVLNLADETVLYNTWVAHGKNSGGEFAKRFSNRPSSNQSSLGFYVTGNTYYGEHGLSLHVNGVEKGFNDLALRRNIVVHGADYIGERRISHGTFMGRSFGCPAVPVDDCNNIIGLIKGGTCLFIYYPDKKYLQKSKILNG